ncbi:MAG: formate dehydrogenase subunit alpha [Xanthomonadales bacterium]|nr:formate dehydrogenase subunit alpha [Xanthomonadales bacterium]
MKIRAEVDGVTREFPSGLSVLEALRSIGIELPTLCDDQRLEPAGQCWACSVDIADAPGAAFRTRPSCREPLRDGSSIRSANGALDAFRHGLLGQLAARVEPDEQERFPDKALHRLLREHGIAGSAPASPPMSIDTSHPYIRVDMSRCIACSRCVRICEEVQGESIWHVFGRGPDLRIAPQGEVPLGASGCVGCGACVDTCPTAALTDAGAWREPIARSWTRTTCAYCAVGCELQVGVTDDRIVAVRPALDGPSNRGHACVKGRYAHGYVDAEDRITTPMLRRDGQWQRVGWDEAETATVAKLRAILAAHGPQAVGVLGSARGTNEEAFLTQKFARLVLGTNNVDCCARVCHMPSAAALKRVLGTGAATNSFDDIEQTRCFLVVGANPLANHPVVGARIRQQVRAGARLVVVDPRRTPLAEIADVHLALRAGTNVPLLNALAHVLVLEDRVDHAFLAARVDELDEFVAFIREWTPERAASICGVAAADIRNAARIYAQQAPAMCVHGLGLTEHVQGTEGVMALINLALLTGNLGRAGAGVNPLRGQNNVQGVAVMGCEPDSLTGGAGLNDARPRFEARWGAPVPAQPGLNVLGMMDAARAGHLKALYVIGFDVLASLANMQETAAALAQIELVIVQDLFLNDTAREFGHIFLPAVTSFEKDGTFMNSERRIQRIRRAVMPRGQARDDATILVRLAAAFGHGTQFPSADPEQVWDEVRELWPAGAGISYARIEHGGIQWPCRDESHPGTSILHVERFAHGPRATLRRIDYRPTAETVDADHPFLLSTGRDLHQFNVGTMTGRTAQNRLRPTDTLDMHPQDAAALDLRDGQDLRVTSRHGTVVLPLRISHCIEPGQLFTTFHDPARAVNRLTGPTRDTITSAPEYKVTAVRVEGMPVHAE